MIQSNVPYVWRDGKPVEKHKAPRKNGPFLMPAFQEYRSPVTGELITSKSHRREDLKRHGCIDARELKGELLANGKRHRG